MNKIRLTAVPIFLFLLLSSAGKTAFGGDDDPFVRIRENAKAIQSLQADFIQTKHMKILIKPLISKGRFCFKSPASIRWEYIRPIKSVVMMHQGEIHRYFEKDGKMVSDAGASLQVMQVVMQNITMWLEGRFQDNPDFSTRLEESRIILTPSHSMAGIIERIELNLSERPGIIDRIDIYEGEGSSTRIEFQQMKVNQPLDNAVFEDVS